jgi:hypothetical protein
VLRVAASTGGDDAGWFSSRNRKRETASSEGAAGRAEAGRKRGQLSTFAATEGTYSVLSPCGAGARVVETTAICRVSVAIVRIWSRSCKSFPGVSTNQTGEQGLGREYGAVILPESLGRSKEVLVGRSARPPPPQRRPLGCWD